MTANQVAAEPSRDFRLSSMYKLLQYPTHKHNTPVAVAVNVPKPLALGRSPTRQGGRHLGRLDRESLLEAAGISNTSRLLSRQVMKLYGYRNGRTLRALWALEEVGATYEYVEVDVMHGQGREPWFLKINPAGKVPVLDDNGTIITESAAIRT